MLTSLSLINTDTGRVLRRLTNNSTIDLNTDGTNLTVRANTFGFPSTGSVVFTITGTSNFKFTDNTVPYSLFGGTASTYAPWNPAPGTYRLEARSWTRDNATGSRLNRIVVNFTVINSASVTTTTTTTSTTSTTTTTTSTTTVIGTTTTTTTTTAIPGANNTYYAAPNGTANNLGTFASPFRIADFWAVASPGKTLILLDGRYTGAASMIKPTSGLSGTNGNPITVKALNDGKVEIDGQSLHAPVYLNNNNYFVLEGFNAHHAGSNSTSGDGYSVSVIELQGSSNCILRRICGWEARNGNTNIFGVHNGSNILLEDCAGWGTARKTFSNSQQGNYVTFRRCFGRWEGSTTYGPKKTFGLSYNSYNAIAENCIGTWDGLKMPQSYQLLTYNNTVDTSENNGSPTNYSNYQVHQPGGIFSHDGFDVLPDVANIQILGCIAYLKQNQRYHNSPNRGNAAPFSYEIKGVTIKDSVSFIEPGTNHTYIQNVNLQNSGATPGQNTVDNLTRIGGRQDSWTIDTEWTATDVLSSTSCSMVTATGGDILDIKHPSGDGAIIKKRYVNGVLTNDDLWPWPMNQRIIDAMTLGGYTPIDITSEIAGLCNPNSTSTGPIIQKARTWLNSSGAERTAVEADLDAWKVNIDTIIAALKPTYSETQTGKRLYRNFTNTTFINRYPDHQYHMYIPTQYTPSKPMGLIIWLHGGGSWTADEITRLADYEMDDETVTGRSYPRTETDTSNYILVTPIAPFGATIPHPQHASRWDTPVADQYITDIITEVATHYNVDYNKVVIAGFSMGGIGAYHLALRLNDRLSGVMASAGSWELGSWADLKHMPMYLIHGVTDAYFTATNNCRNHNTAIEYPRHAFTRLSAGSNIHVKNEYPGGHGWDSVGEGHWRSFINGLTGWITGKTRNPYRSNTVAYNPWRSYIQGSNFNVTWNEDPSLHTMWITIKELGPGTINYDRALVSGNGGCSSLTNFNNWSLTLTNHNMSGGRVEATIVAANQISVTTQNVTKFSLWLHPNMVNVNAPVQVSVNGAPYKSYNLAPSLLKALQSYERRWDWGMIYHAELEITL